jgi:ABC-type antimicrobial peptide transport system permease subunit
MTRPLPRSTLAIPGQAAPTPNEVWLRTSDDPATLSGIRAALGSGTTRLDRLLDRRQLIDEQQTDPLQISFFGVLGLGATTAVLLALLGTWLASWLNARARLTSFAVLRALGTTPRQTMRILLWEQGIVYASALALGIALGGLLEQAVLPTLVFASLVSSTSFNGRLNPIIDVPPVHTVVPGGALAALLSALIAACALALGLMIAVIARASLAQSLRLNED